LVWSGRLPGAGHHKVQAPRVPPMPGRAVRRGAGQCARGGGAVQRRGAADRVHHVRRAAGAGRRGSALGAAHQAEPGRHSSRGGRGGAGAGPVQRAGPHVQRAGHEHQNHHAAGGHRQDPAARVVHGRGVRRRPGAPGGGGAASRAAGGPAHAREVRGVLAVDVDAEPDRAAAGRAGHLLHAAGRRHDAPAAREQPAPLQAGRGRGDPAAVAARRRRGPEPGPRVARVPDGRVLEPQRREPGHRPHPPPGPEAPHHRHALLYQEQHRGEDHDAAAAQGQDRRHLADGQHAHVPRGLPRRRRPARRLRGRSGHHRWHALSPAAPGRTQPPARL
ncbi:hypothetical protein GGF43_003998, partial [Coemansia sp. RSA 2618]